MLRHSRTVCANFSGNDGGFRISHPILDLRSAMLAVLHSRDDTTEDGLALEGVVESRTDMHRGQILEQLSGLFVDLEAVLSDGPVLNKLDQYIIRKTSQRNNMWQLLTSLVR